jgi:hypothetical protein
MQIKRWKRFGLLVGCEKSPKPLSVSRFSGQDGI